MSTASIELRLGPGWIGTFTAARLTGWLLVLGQCILVSSVAWLWLSGRSTRLYLDEQQAQERSGATRATQRFRAAGGRVVPEIVTTGDERLSFQVAVAHSGELRFRATPTRHATLEVAIVERGVRRALHRRSLSEPMEIALPLAPTVGFLELASEGDLVWSDPRVVEQAPLTPSLLGLLALLVLQRLRAERHVSPALPQIAWARQGLLHALTLVVGLGLGLVGLEVGLRTIGHRLPSWITHARLQLGEVSLDPRWQASPLYGTRLSPRLDTYCAWEHGDIVRMGFLPPGLAAHPAYRFPFVTDAEGFRNSGAEGVPTTVAALGDSFTDGMTLPVELTWPARLSSLLGVGVRNYGTAGFGPGQELLVLKEHVRARRPRRVVVGFFAGNDLVDAERFEAFRTDGGPLPVAQKGWKFKGVITRFDRLYLKSLYDGVFAFLDDRKHDPASARSAGASEDYSGDDPRTPRTARAAVDRGLFTVPVAGRVVQFAFLPPYLNRLTLTRRELEGSRGWDLTRRAYEEMERLVRADGGELIVLFIPSKDQVYLPLLEASLPRSDLRRALGDCLGHPSSPPEVEVLMQNRLALNDLMREFCAARGITFLDLTADLQSTLQRGHNVYFPDDSHWNAAGHETAAMALADLLRGQRL